MNTICYVITGLKRGGAEKQLLIMSREAIRLGFHVDIYVLSNIDDMLEDFIAIGASVSFLRINKYNFLYKIFSFAKKIKHKDIKFIHAHMYHSIIFSRLVKILIPKLKIISSAHCNEECFKLRGKLLMVTDFLSSYNTHVSIDSLSLFLNKDVFSRHNSLVINNAVEVNSILYPFRENIITSVGRLEPSKGFDIIIKAFSRINKKNGDFKLYIIGDGPAYKDLNNLIISLRLEKKIFLLGNRSNVLDIVSKSKLFISASKSESFGMAICEAIGSNIISLIPDLPSINEVVGKNYPDFLKHNNSSEDIYNKMLDILSNEKKIAFNDNSKYIKDNYSAIKIFNQWLSIYKK
ncbi:glycosyltransferase [Photobacterium piscicola]|uniref:glycosyltransferase n=1 Tax=Photobacterium piscicola TaxID=1378299 RepID=UPI003736D4B1